MKTRSYTKTLIAWAVAVVAVTGAVSQAQDQPMPPSADSALPAGIVPGSPLADVVKMVQAGVDASTIESYIANAQSPFNLDADKIIALKDMGVPNEIINAMMDRDKILYAATMAPAAAPATAVDSSVVDTAPPPEVTVNYFYDSLSPYGSWVDVPGYGRCWRPTVVIYDSAWRPYCDRGHWVYTDYGWYWDSYYSWGITFHYGRWFRNPQFGWCWYPDTVWAPSWVTWRSDNDYCGWAPLPPFADFRPGFGFYYRGASVALGFDFGLGADCYTFVSPDRFCDRHPRSFCLAPQRVPEIFRRTTIVNNFNVNGRRIVNRGIAVDRITRVTHRTLEPLHISSLPNAGRQGWRGEGFERTLQRTPANHNAGRNFNSSSANPQLRHGPELRHDNNNANNANANYRQNPGQPVQESTANRENFRRTTQSPRQVGNQAGPVHPPAQSPSQTGGGVRVQPQNFIREQAQPQPPQTRQFNTGAANRTVPQTEWRPNRGVDPSAAGGVQYHGAWQLQQRQFGVQNQPRVEPPRVAQPRVEPPRVEPPRVEPPRVETRQNATAPAQRTFNPPAQNQPRNANSGSNNNSNNGPDRGGNHR